MHSSLREGHFMALEHLFNRQSGRDHMWKEAVFMAFGEHFGPIGKPCDWFAEADFEGQTIPESSGSTFDDLLEEIELRFADLLALALKVNTDFFNRAPGWEVLNDLCTTRCHIELVFQILVKVGTEFECRDLIRMRAFVDGRINRFIECIDGEFLPRQADKLLWEALRDHPPVFHMEHKGSRWYTAQPLGWGVLTEEDKALLKEAALFLKAPLFDRAPIPPKR